MKHRFDRLAKNAVSPIWEYVSGAIARIQQRLTDRTDDLRDIKRALEKAERYARDALLLMAEKIYVFPAKLRERMVFEAAAPVPSNQRTPLFNLGITLTPCHPGREATRDPEQKMAIPEQLGPGSAPDGLGRDDTFGSQGSKLQRRICALEDVLANRGKHAARMKRAQHKTEAGSDQPVRLKSEGDLLFAHVIRTLGDPAYRHTDDYARLHKLMLERG